MILLIEYQMDKTDVLIKTEQTTLLTLVSKNLMNEYQLENMMGKLGTEVHSPILKFGVFGDKKLLYSKK
jgi:hypothetical protein